MEITHATVLSPTVRVHIVRAVLITGATGFSGSALVEQYAVAGYEVHGVYRDPADDRSWLPDDVAFHAVDLNDGLAVLDVVGAVTPTVVHHLAAQSSAAVSLQDPMGTVTANTLMQYNVLEAVRRATPTARVVVVGSCDEYGDVAPDDNPITETQELRPVTPYALSKVVQDLMGQQYAIAHNLQVVRVRPFLQLGPRRSDRFAAGSFARQIAEIEIGNREPIIRVGNIDLQRDFCDVRDVARALALVAEAGVARAVYNIASGRAHTLRDLLTLMLERAGVEATIMQDETRLRSGEPLVLIGDATRLRAATGWTPQISFEQSAADTLSYWQVQVRRALLQEGKA
jgi:GDP-4-dehydro-6-deoxy-D-mannose reductase